MVLEAPSPNDKAQALQGPPLDCVTLCSPGSNGGSGYKSKQVTASWGAEGQS